MTDRATPNLPARDLGATREFYATLGFAPRYADDGWLILTRGELQLEFFPYPDLDPATSSFGCCLRLDDLDAFVAVCREAGLPDTTVGWPRIQPPWRDRAGLRIGGLVDPDGSLLRLVQNP